MFWVCNETVAACLDHSFQWLGSSLLLLHGNGSGRWPQLQSHLTDDEPEAQNLPMPHLKPRPRSRVGQGSQTRAVVSGPSSWCLAVSEEAQAGAEDVGSAGELGTVCLQWGLSLLFFFLGDNTHMVCKGLPRLPPTLSPTPAVHSWPLGVLTVVP